MMTSTRMRGRLPTSMGRLLLLSVLGMACSGRQPETPATSAGAAVVQNAIDVGLIRTTFFVVESVDGVKVHEKMDFKRRISIAPGKRELTVTYYTDALWGARDSAETCTILVDAAPDGDYAVIGAAEEGEWRASLVDRLTAREVPCLFADEAGVRSAPRQEAEGAAAASPPAAAEAVAGEDTAPAPNGGVTAGKVATGDVAAESMQRPSRRRSFCGRGFYRVAHVDGDATFVLDRSDRVRLIGVQPGIQEAALPEREPVGIEGKCVRFEYEPTNLIDGHRDRDGRLLAYVYLEDGTFVNVEWIRQGRVRASDERHRYLADFLAAQSVARRAGVGVWNGR